MLTVEQRDRLESLIVSSEDAATFCARLRGPACHAPLAFSSPQSRCAASSTSSPASTPALNDTVTGASLGRLLGDRPLPTFLTTALHGTVGYFPEGMPLAYLVATVMTGLGLLIGSLIPVSHPEQVARQSAPLPSPLSPLPSVVGRITGMVDCKWATIRFRDPKIRQSTHQPSLVSLGDKFALASGLMEITYDTGAKVILQGPVTYEVESNGGYLAVGKLTGKLEKKSGRAEGGEAANQKSANQESKSHLSLTSTIHYPFRYPHSHRHRHRPGHRVRRRSRSLGRYRIPRLPRRDQGASGIRTRRRSRRRAVGLT